jgi:hypothetical protein
LKFKSVFVLFNVAVGLSFVFVFAMPFVALGGGYAATFWRTNWPLASALVVVLGAIDVFFAFNWKLFTLLEREDWPALAAYLEERVVRKGRWNSRLVRLLANTHLVLSDADAVVALEAEAAKAKPSLLDKNALVFGVARVLKNDPPSAAAFFASRRGPKKSENPEWVEWYYAFCLLLDRKFEEAADVLLPLSGSAKDAVVAALCASFLRNAVARALPSRAAECEAAAAAAAERVKRKFATRAAWNKELENARADIHVVVLGKSIEEAADLLYA